MTWYVDAEHGGMGGKGIWKLCAFPYNPLVLKEKTISLLLHTIAQGKTEPKI